MRRSRPKASFTLVELLVVMGIISILVAISFPAYRMAMKHANSTGCMSRMRTLGIGFNSYAGDNDGQLPPRSTSPGVDRWPTLLLPYVGDVHCYLDPGDPIANAVPLTNLVSNTANNSSFFFNGFNDLGAYTNQNVTVRLVNLSALSNLALLGKKVNGITQYYMDFDEGNEYDVLNTAAYFSGANYTFADGSSRFIYQSAYNAHTTSASVSDGNLMWLVNPNWPIPNVAGHTGTP